jgi:hypothetical protein
MRGLTPQPKRALDHLDDIGIVNAGKLAAEFSG